MDPVSRILIDRERRPSALVPFVILAILLHSGAAAAVYIASRARPMRHGQLPGVAVRLIRPQPPAKKTSSPRRQPARSEPRPEPVPKPSPPPEPKPSQPKAASTTTAAAMATSQSKATPRPTATAASGGGARGLSLGEAASGPPAIPSDFQFTYYVDRMLGLIEQRWYKPHAPAGTRARVRFTITRSGYLENVRIEEGSGTSSFDRAALRAVYAANPLPPLPHAYRKDSLTVHLSFSE